MAKGSGSGPAILLEGVKFGWPGSDGFSLAVRHLDIGLGESVLLLGPSGSGKSTLLSLICGIVTPAAGNITVLGEDLAAMSAVARDRFRAEHYGIIFQMFNLLPYAGALDNVLLPLHFAPRRMRAVQRNGSAEQAASGLLKALGFDDIHASSRKTANLSIGQQQRVAAARALIGSPELIIADEPTSALDDQMQNVFLDLLFEQVRKAGSTLVMVSHDTRLSKRFDRTVRIDNVLTVQEHAA